MEAKPIEHLTYEDAYRELEAIVAGLENEQQVLEQAIAQFERGQVLARYCAALLDEAELKIQQLSGESFVDFDPQD